MQFHGFVCFSYVFCGSLLFGASRCWQYSHNCLSISSFCRKMGHRAAHLGSFFSWLGLKIGDPPKIERFIMMIPLEIWNATIQKWKRNGGLEQKTTDTSWYSEEPQSREDLTITLKLCKTKNGNSLDYSNKNKTLFLRLWKMQKKQVLVGGSNPPQTSYIQCT